MPQAASARRWTWLFAGLGVITLGVLLFFALKSLLNGHSAAMKKPPRIVLLPDKPPPPPPPPKEEKKPEPPKEQKEMKMDQVEKKADQPPPDPTLKMEGAAGNAPSAFGAGNVTNEDLSRKSGGGGTIGGGPPVASAIGNAFGGYAGVIKSELQRQLARRPDLRRRQYRIEVQVWVADDGRLKNFELLGTTNDGDTDDAIRKVLASLPAFSEPPPARMPQPIRLSIVTSGHA